MNQNKSSTNQLQTIVDFFQRFAIPLIGISSILGLGFYFIRIIDIKSVGEQPIPCEVYDDFKKEYTSSTNGIQQLIYTENTSPGSDYVDINLDSLSYLLASAQQNSKLKMHLIKDAKVNIAFELTTLAGAVYYVSNGSEFSALTLDSFEICRDKYLNSNLKTELDNKILLGDNTLTFSIDVSTVQSFTTSWIQNGIHKSRLQYTQVDNAFLNAFKYPLLFIHFFLKDDHLDIVSIPLDSTGIKSCSKDYQYLNLTSFCPPGNCNN